jgi:MFS family permease
MSIKTPPGKPDRRSWWLIHRAFTLLSVGQAISNIGDFVYSTTLLIWIFALSGSAAAVSGVLVAEYVPYFALGPVAGVFVDRWNRLRTMLASDLARMGIALLPLCVPDVLRLPAIYASVFLISCISRFFMPARSALTQVIVAPEQQGQAASIGQVTQALAIVVGPALASPLYFLVGPVVAVLINAASFGVSALFLWSMRGPGVDLVPSAAQRLTSSLERAEQPGGIRVVINDMLAGFALVLKTRVLLIVTLLAMIAMFGAGAINSLEIVYISQRLHAHPDLYGYLSAASGLGTLIGAVICGLLVKRIPSRSMLAGSLILIGGGIVIYALQTWVPLAIVLSFLLGFPQAGINIGLAPLLMQATPRRFMGRVQAVFMTATYAASLLAIALCGVLGTFLPAYQILLMGGILLALAGIFGWLTLPPAASPEAQAGSFVLDSEGKDRIEYTL